MVRKVVIPATISVLTLVLFSLSLNIRSSICVLPRLSRRVCGHCPVQNQPRPALFAFAGRVSYSPRPPGRPEQGPSQNADVSLLSADPEGVPGRRADRIARPYAS